MCRGSAVSFSAPVRSVAERDVSAQCKEGEDVNEELLANRGEVLHVPSPCEALWRLHEA